VGAARRAARLVLVLLVVVPSVLFLGATTSHAATTVIWDGAPGITVSPLPTLDGSQKVTNFTITYSGTMYSGNAQMYCRSSAMTPAEEADIAADGSGVLSGSTTISYATSPAFHNVSTITTAYAGSGCTAPAFPIAVRVTTSTPGGAKWYLPGTSTEPPSSCSDFLVDEQAGYVSGSLSVRWRVKASTNIPGAGWKVYEAPSLDGETGALIGSVPSTALDGFAGWYGEDFVTADTPYVRVYRGNSTTCYVTLAVPDTAVEIDPPGTGEDGDGADCGLNPFCYTKAALIYVFQPSDESVTAIQGTLGNLADSVPWGYAVVAYSWLDGAFTLANEGCGPGANACGALAFTLPDYLGMDFDGDQVVLLDEGSTGSELLADLRPVLTVAIWLALIVPLGFWMFRKLAPGGGDD